MARMSCAMRNGSMKLKAISPEYVVEGGGRGDDSFRGSE